ncbi:MAG: MarR family transcriptional regulator [Xanthomonadaceae bacterium]|nr:MarR family transcriptional regulator [Xanthomonadaceae bacterium]MDE1962270.1 MarR family transcriptional regulator [Xanthomonadaceae bacterium]
MPRHPAPPAPDPQPSLCLRQQLCFAVYAASNRMTRLARPMLDELGLTYPQYLVMLVLWEHGTCTVGEIGEALLLDSGTLTPLLKRMEANGLVTRRRDPDDERCVRIAASPRGRALKQRAAGLPEYMRCQVALPPARMDQLRDQLLALVEAMTPRADA